MCSMWYPDMHVENLLFTIAHACMYTYKCTYRYVTASEKRKEKKDAFSHWNGEESWYLKLGGVWGSDCSQKYVLSCLCFHRWVGGSVSDCIQKFAAHQLQSNLLGGGTSVRIIKVRAWDSKLWVHTLVAQMGLGGTYGHLWVTQRSCTEILVIVRIMSASCFCCMEYNE